MTLGAPASSSHDEPGYVSLNDRISQADELCRTLEADLAAASAERRVTALPDLDVIEGTEARGALHAVRGSQAYLAARNAEAEETRCLQALSEARGVRDELLRQFYASNTPVGERRKAAELGGQTRTELPWAASDEDRAADERRRSERGAWSDRYYD